jgi:hypothetical protein
MNFDKEMVNIKLKTSTFNIDNSAKYKKYIQYVIIILIIIFMLNNAIPFIFNKIMEIEEIQKVLVKTSDFLNFRDVVEKNKCNPIVMPFISLINKGEISTSENFQQCMESMFSSFFGEYIKMFSSNQNILLGTIKSMLSDIGNMKKVINGIRTSLINTLSDIYARLQNTFKRVHELFLHMKKLVIGIINVFQDLARTLNFVFFTFSSIWNGPIGGVARFFGCFSKHTQIQLSKKSKIKTKSICNIEIGDILLGGGVVTSVMKFRKNGNIIYNYKGVTVSGNHPVFSEDENKWKYVKDMDESYIIDFKDEYIYCLNTSNNIIYINNIKFTDYKECSNEILNKELIKYAHYHLNQNYKKIYTNISTEPSGFYNQKEILNLNDENVLGVIKTNAKNIKNLYKFNNVIASGSVFVFTNCEWKQMCQCGEKVKNDKEFIYNIITKDNLVKINNTYFRDFYISFSNIYNKKIDSVIRNELNQKK